MVDACKDGEDDENDFEFDDKIGDWDVSSSCSDDTEILLHNPNFADSGIAGTKRARNSNCSPSSSASCRRRAGALLLSSLFVGAKKTAKEAFFRKWDKYKNLRSHCKLK